MQNTYSISRIKSEPNGRISATYTPVSGIQKNIAKNIYKIFRDITMSRLINLDICFKTQQKQKIENQKKKRATKQLTAYGKNMLLNGGNIIYKTKKSVKLFLTLTFITANPLAIQFIGQNSGYIINRLCTFLRRQARHESYMCVWEMQKRGVPHLHLIIEKSQSIDLKQFLKKTRLFWHKLNHELCTKSGINFFLNETNEDFSNNVNMPIINLQLFSKAHVCYIAKYLTKGTNQYKGEDMFIPGRWYYISNSLIKRIKEKTIILEIRNISKTLITDIVNKLTKIAKQYKIFGYIAEKPLEYGCLVYRCHINRLAENKRLNSEIIRLFKDTQMRINRIKKVSHDNNKQQNK